MYVYQLTGSALLTGTVMAVRLVAAFLAGPVGGPVPPPHGNVHLRRPQARAMALLLCAAGDSARLRNVDESRQPTLLEHRGSGLGIDY
jgi:hypothetical protein